MSIEIIKNRLAQYNCETQIAEEHAIKEITQEIILMSLSRQGFFVKAEFHGGTALRILYGLPRFSEDLGLKYLTFPFPFSIEAKTLSSSFSGKINN